MNIDLRYAGLPREVERRVRLAASALAAHRVTANASAWDGEQCDAVVLDGADAVGKYVLKLAQQRGIPVLDVRPRGDSVIESVANIVWLTRSLRELLRTAVSTGVTRADAQPALLRLATDPTLRGVDLEAYQSGTRIWLLPSSGRVVSVAVSDRLRAQGQFGAADWSFQPIPVQPGWHVPGEVSSSLDAFYLQAAWQLRGSLPPFAAGQYRLREWPDLGTAEDFVGALRLVQVLLRRAADPDELARSSGLAQEEVCACLWAFKASGILSGQAAEVPPAPARHPRPAFAGLWGRLASHFGLARAS
jgi:hypothetical protein